MLFLFHGIGVNSTSFLVLSHCLPFGVRFKKCVMQENVALNWIFFSVIINLIILLGKRFIFEAAGVDSLNISHFRMFIKRYFILEGYMASAKSSSYFS